MSGTALFPASRRPPAYRRLPREALRESPLNWRVICARLVVYGLALGVASLALPGFEIKRVAGQEVYSVMILAAIYGIVVAVLKPVFQFIALPFVIETSGLVVIAINVVIFALFDAFASPLVDFEGVGWFFASAAFVWVFAFVLENVLGVPPPIVSDIPPDESGDEEAAEAL